ncbi:hypothetical protein Efla_007621 [Eimeria flavescens]
MSSSHNDRSGSKSSGGRSAAGSRPASGNTSPLSVFELPTSHVAVGGSLEASVSADAREPAMTDQSLRDTREAASSNAMGEWPRGRQRNAVSRVGYISDEEGGPAGAQKLSGRHSLTTGGPPTQPISDSGRCASGLAPFPKARARPRIQHTHLAVPTDVGHIRPRMKLAESPRELPAPPSDVKARPAALSSMAAKQPSFGLASDTPVIKTRAPSRQNIAGHISAKSTSAPLPPSQVTQRIIVSDISSAEGSKPGSMEPTEKALLQRQSSGPHSRHSLEGVRAAPAAGDEGGLAGLRTHNEPADGTGDRAKGVTAESGEAAAEAVKSPRISGPSRTSAVRKSFAEVFAGEEGRRAAALASRINSRAISRAEGSADLMHLAQRADVAAAAAEQLRKMAAVSMPQAPREAVVEAGSQAKDEADVQRLLVPLSIHKAQQEVKAMLEVEQQRRAAVSASRARSRVISRSEGAMDPDRLAERSDVAKAAAAQLRKLAQEPPRAVSLAQQVGHPLSPLCLFLLAAMAGRLSSMLCASCYFVTRRDTRLLPPATKRRGMR